MQQFAFNKKMRFVKPVELAALDLDFMPTRNWSLSAYDFFEKEMLVILYTDCSTRWSNQKKKKQEILNYIKTMKLF